VQRFDFTRLAQKTRHQSEKCRDSWQGWKRAYFVVKGFRASFVLLASEKLF
jgi:hypothetical protein